MTRPRLILASGSAIRATILNHAGVPFVQKKPNVDEAAIKAASADANIEQTALRIAEPKALAITANSDDYVLGADQILEYRGKAFDKAQSLEEARTRLLTLQGNTHSLVNAIAVARDGEIIWRHLDRADLVMRALTETEIDAYLKEAGESVLASVGAYQVEGLGARLFERIDGDYFAVLGLSLFPLLGFLKEAGFLDY